MNIYRVSVDDDGGSTFCGTQAEAMKEHRAIEKSGLESKVERLEVPTDKAGLVSALNLILCHPDHWPGERITPIRRKP